MNYEGELMSTLSELKMYALARGGLSYRIYRNLNVGGSRAQHFQDSALSDGAASGWPFRATMLLYSESLHMKRRLQTQVI